MYSQCYLNHFHCIHSFWECWEIWVRFFSEILLFISFFFSSFCCCICYKLRTQFNWNPPKCETFQILFETLRSMSRTLKTCFVSKRLELFCNFNFIEWKYLIAGNEKRQKKINKKNINFIFPNRDVEWEFWGKNVLVIWKIDCIYFNIHRSSAWINGTKIQRMKSKKKKKKFKNFKEIN